MFYFEKDKKISIGRAKSCLVKCTDKTFSSKHSVIMFDNTKNKWILYDGTGDGKTTSTNGTW